MDRDNVSERDVAKFAANSPAQTNVQRAGVTGSEQINSTTSLIRFYRAYPHAIPAMRADRSALGTLPAKAYQYCEAVTAASGFGWYVFPAAELQFWFDGVDVHWAVGDSWQKLSIEYLPHSERWWKPNCPSGFENKEPPFVTAIGVPGFVQIWSGLLVETAKDWSVLARPLANIAPSREYFCYEGIVETDRYSPAPLFINLKLQVTNEAIVLPADEPLFQVQPVPRISYARQTLSRFDNREMVVDSAQGGLSASQWEGYGKTVRAVDPRVDNHELGQYAKATRKRDTKTIQPLDLS